MIHTWAGQMPVLLYDLYKKREAPCGNGAECKKSTAIEKTFV